MFYYKNYLIDFLTIVLTAVFLFIGPISKWVIDIFVSFGEAVVMIIIIGIISLLILYPITGTIFMPIFKYKNPKNYKYKIKTVKMGDNSTKYVAIVHTSFLGYPRYIVERRFGLYDKRYGIFDEEYTSSYDDFKKHIYYNTKEDALFAITTFKQRKEEDYKNANYWKDKKKQEKKNMKEKSSKITNVNFKDNK